MPRHCLLPTFLLGAGSGIQQHHLRGHTAVGFSRSQPSLSPTHGCCLHPPICPSSPCQVKWTILSGWGCGLGSALSSPREPPTPQTPRGCCPHGGSSSGCPDCPPTLGVQWGSPGEGKGQQKPLAPLSTARAEHVPWQLRAHPRLLPAPRCKSHSCFLPCWEPHQPPGTRSAPEDPTITKWGAPLGGREASTVNWMTPCSPGPQESLP